MFTKSTQSILQESKLGSQRCRRSLEWQVLAGEFPRCPLTSTCRSSEWRCASPPENRREAYRLVKSASVPSNALRTTAQVEVVGVTISKCPDSSATMASILVSPCWLEVSRSLISNLCDNAISNAIALTPSGVIASMTSLQVHASTFTLSQPTPKHITTESRCHTWRHHQQGIVIIGHLGWLLRAVMRQ